MVKIRGRKSPATVPLREYLTVQKHFTLSLQYLAVLLGQLQATLGSIV
jgi:hypothetical protein